jgi:TPR repeat protein
MYAFGRGVAKDETEAARWVFSAIQNGDDTATKEMTSNALAWSAGFRAELQRRLRDAGTYSGPSDGDFGPATTRAIADLAARKTQH